MLITPNSVPLMRLLMTPRVCQSLSNMLPIEPLSVLFAQSQAQQEPRLSLEKYSPSQLFLQVLRALKQSLYREQKPRAQIISCIKTHTRTPEHMRLLLQLLLPGDGGFPQLKQVYLNYATEYLTKGYDVNQEQVQYLLDNLERMIADQTQLTDDNWINRDYTQEQILAHLLVPRIMSLRDQLSPSFFIRLTKVCSMLSVLSPELAQFLFTELQSPWNRFKMKDIIFCLVYLSKMNAFPIEYFYERKNLWINTIQSYNKFSKKKSLESIKMFQILVLQNPSKCQKNIHKLMQILLECVPSFDHDQLATLWLLCSKAKFSMQRQLIETMLFKINQSVEYMDNRQLCTLVRAFGKFRLPHQYSQLMITIVQKISTKISDERIYEKEIIHCILDKRGKFSQLLC